MQFVDNSMSNRHNAGDRLKFIRKQQNLTQQEMAQVLGLSQGYYAYLETGKRDISRHILDKLKSLYDISPDWLLYGIEQNDITPARVEEPAKPYQTHKPEDKTPHLENKAENDTQQAARDDMSQVLEELTAIRRLLEELLKQR
ncbi:MAG: helix-turn-helix domain-containing protein [Bacteroidetes bacterium]|nr:helix-turn-helix domain-containing protein [Bacteroidota bacterium]